MRRILLALALAAAAALGVLEVAWGQTYPRDDTGAVGAPCFWQGAGVFNACSDTNPLPTAAAGGPPPSSDPTGWGRRFFTGALLGTNVVGAWIDEQTAYAWRIGGAFTLSFFRSSDRGITWSTMGALSFPNSGALTGALGPLTDNTFLISNGPGSNVATLHKGNTTWAAVSGSAVVGMNSMWSLIQQGGTILAAGDATSPPFRICRSTNLGSSITCTQHAGMDGVNASTQANGAQRIASPAVNTWLVIDDAREVWRSTDDGVSFTSVTTLAGAAAAGQNIVCLSSTVCLASTAVGNIFRSADAGLTWAQVHTLQGALAVTVFLNYGNGVVVAANALDSAAASGARSADFGATWTQLPPLTGGPAGNAQMAATRAGRGLIFSAATGITYSVALGAGDTGLVGANGVRLEIDGLGRLTANQGIGAANSGAFEAWHTTPVQRGTLTNSQTTGAADTAVTVTIAAVASARAHLYKVTGRCSAGTSVLTVQSPSGTTIWSTEAGAVGTANFTEAWNPGLTGASNTAMVITLGTCGAANTGTLAVQTDRF